MERYLRIMLERIGQAVYYFEFHVDRLGRFMQAGKGQHIAAFNVFGGYAGHIDSNPAAGYRHVYLMLVSLEAAHTAANIARQNGNLLSQIEPPIAQCAGNNRAEAADGEDAVDRQAR